ncbi:MAG: HEAT repeat domain-containing protein [Gemmatimonadetes bacterium]|nr:HEAT repeat domain-containing protein [Gemmatimonadota bacterium]
MAPRLRALDLPDFDDLSDARTALQIDREAMQAAVQEARAEALSARTFARGDLMNAMADARASLDGINLNLDLPLTLRAAFTGSPRTPWAQQDPADSLYRQAREQLNRGDYRRAASLFKDLPQRFPNSAYASDAPYWQAFALYRIGGTGELQEALAALEAQKAKYPSARTQQADASALAARIAGVLSTRGMSGDAAVKRALSSAGAECDREEQSVRAEALSALMQTDPEAAQQLTKRILARRDECSVPLRRNAVFIVGNKRDATAAATLIGVARGDASADVRTEAVNWLTRMPGDDALNALIDMSRASEDERVQRSAVRALANHPSPKARSAVRALVEKNDAPEQLRLTALDAFDRDRMTADDAAWLRGLYAKTDSPRIKARIASAVGRLGGDANNQWLLALAKNEDESMEARMQAIYRAGESLDVAGLGKLYDGMPQRPMRESIINLLGTRKEPEAVDKLLDIARTGTDPQLRRSAINVLSRKKDPRTTKLLMEIIDK